MSMPNVTLTSILMLYVEGAMINGEQQSNRAVASVNCLSNKDRSIGRGSVCNTMPRIAITSGYYLVNKLRMVNC